MVDRLETASNQLKYLLYSHPCHLTSLRFWLLVIYCIVQNHFYLVDFYCFKIRNWRFRWWWTRTFKKTLHLTSWEISWQRVWHLLNFFFFLIWWFGTVSWDFFLCLLLWHFSCIQLQGTLYNYYYVILRNKSVGETQQVKFWIQIWVFR
jgi:hypothetical protein